MSKEFLPWYQIKAGQIWKPTDGSVFKVRVTHVTSKEICYCDVKNSNKQWDKDPFTFQVRYELDVDSRF